MVRMWLLCTGFFFTPWEVYPLPKDGQALRNPGAPEESTLHIYARDSLSCPSPGNLWIAKGAVVVQRGSLIIRGDCIVLEFEREPPSKIRAKATKKDFPSEKNLEGKKKSKIPLLVPGFSSEVKSLSAQGHVRIEHPSGTLSSPRATYHFPLQKIYASGGNMVLKSKKWTLRCHESLCYSHGTHGAKARGGVEFLTGKEGERGLQCQELVAQFGPKHSTSGPSQKPELDLLWVRADYPVRLWDGKKRFVAKAKHALWDEVHRKIYLKESVKMCHGEQYLSGSKAIMDLEKNTMVVEGEEGENHGPGVLRALIPTTSFYSRKKGA